MTYRLEEASQEELVSRNLFDDFVEKKKWNETNEKFELAIDWH